MKRHATKDPVTPQVYAEVIARDLRIAGGCVAPHLDPMAGECHDRWGNLVRPYAVEALTLDHVREEPGGRRRSEPRWLVAACSGHHVFGGWCSANRPKLREYLEKVNQ